jgi:phospholipid/cholesterol/gamma-HCH transport system substrate-binding protein
VKVDTKAKLAFIGLTGVAQIQLTGGLPESPRLLPTPDEPIPRIPTTPSALQNLSAAADDIVERIRAILSDENVARISGTLDDIHQLSSSIAGQKEDIAALIRNLREVSINLNATLVKTQGSLDTIDRNVVKNLPAIIDKLDATLANLEQASKNANRVIGDNREAISDFSQNGLGQVAPTLAELRTLARDLRRISSRLDRNPAGYATGRTHPEEFSPNESK